MKPLLLVAALLVAAFPLCVRAAPENDFQNEDERFSTCITAVFLKTAADVTDGEAVFRELDKSCLLERKALQDALQSAGYSPADAANTVNFQVRNLHEHLQSRQTMFITTSIEFISYSRAITDYCNSDKQKEVTEIGNLVKNRLVQHVAAFKDPKYYAETVSKEFDERFKVDMEGLKGEKLKATCSGMTADLLKAKELFVAAPQ